MDARDYIAETHLVKYQGAGGDVVIPDDITHIDSRAFEGSSVTSVTIPKNVVKVGGLLSGRVFANCKSLTKVCIESSATEISNDSFDGCDALSILELPADFEYFSIFTRLKQLEYLKIMTFNRIIREDWNDIIAKRIYDWIVNGKPSFSIVSVRVKDLLPQLLKHIAVNNDIDYFHRLTDGDWLKVLSPDDCDFVIANTESVELRATVLKYKNAHYNQEALDRFAAEKTAKELGEKKYTIEDLKAVFTVKEKDDGYVLSDYNGVDEDIIIPELNGKPIVELDFHAFKLNSIVIPSSVKKMDLGFYNAGLKTIRYTGTLSQWCAIKGLRSLLEYRSKEKDVYIDNKKLEGEVIIPDDVTTIEDHAFWGFDKITSVIIPDSVISIGKWVFRSCNKLSSATLPKDLTCIPDGMFDGCDLKSIVIPETVTSIGSCAFRYNNELTDVTIPSGVTFIAQQAFSDCEALTSMVIPDRVKTIGEYAFQECKGLSSLVIPASVTKIGECAFGYTPNLTSITYTGTKEQWKAVDKQGRKWKGEECGICKVICSDGSLKA